MAALFMTAGSETPKGPVLLGLRRGFNVNLMGLLFVLVTDFEALALQQLVTTE